MESTLTVTDGAARKAADLLARESREDLALRVAVRPGGCSGMRYDLFFDDNSIDGDTVLTIEVPGRDPLRVVIDPASAPHLAGASLDFVDTIVEQGFAIDNPNATRTCGCGDSFC